MVRSVVVEAPAWSFADLADPGDPVLPESLVEWAKDVFAAQYGLAGKLTITTYRPVTVDPNGVVPATSVTLKTIKI